MPSFVLDETPTSEVDHREEVCAPLANAVRGLVDATIRSLVEDDEIRAVQAEVEGLVTRLRARQLDGPAGVRCNAEGRAWNWGNAVVGKHDAIAPPLHIVHDPSGVLHADVVLGAAYEGPPGLVHGGVTALLLDQVMGETASAMKRVAMTGTLTMRYRRGTVLGPCGSRVASTARRVARSSWSRMWPTPRGRPWRPRVCSSCHVGRCRTVRPDLRELRPRGNMRMSLMGRRTARSATPATLACPEPDGQSTTPSQSVPQL